MRKFLTLAYSLVLVLALGFSLAGCTAPTGQGATSSASHKASPVAVQSSSKSSSAAGETASESPPAAQADATVTEDGEYSDKEHVALYIHTFGHLPSNYISKTKARKTGWVSSEGNLWDVLPGKSIGGSEYYNDDEQLPEARGRRWTECDIGYEGGFRGPERIVFSNDGLVYYTGDHYETFERLY